MTTSGSVLAGLAASVAASACCAGPLLLVALGIGGAWGASLAALAPYQPYFVAAAVGLFGFAFYRAYRKAPCAQESICADAGVLKRQRLLLWSGAGIATALIAFPWYAPLFS